MIHMGRTRDLEARVKKLEAAVAELRKQPPPADPDVWPAPTMVESKGKRTTSKPKTD